MRDVRVKAVDRKQKLAPALLIVAWVLALPAWHVPCTVHRDSQIHDFPHCIGAGLGPLMEERKIIGKEDQNNEESIGDCSCSFFLVSSGKRIKRICGRP
jgi:hypothetical protein